MGIIQNIIDKYKAKKEVYSQMEDEIKMRKKLEEKQKSANERELERYYREKREAEIEMELKHFRRQKMDNLWKTNIMKEKNKKLYNDRSALCSGKLNVLRSARW